MGVRVTLRRGERGTEVLTHLLGERLLFVRHRSEGGGATRIRTAEIIIDAEVLAALQAGLTNGNGRKRGRPARTTPAPLMREIAPCVCSGMLGQELVPRLTFVYTALPPGRVLATIEELPTVWATGDSVRAARTALVIEVMLLLALNPASARPPVDPKRLLKRETFALPKVRRRG